MRDIELVVKIDKNTYNRITSGFANEDDAVLFENLLKNGIPLPKGHGALKDENYLLNILRCEEYETCTWRNCSDCNREKCIRRRNVLDAPTIVEADRAESEE